MAARDRDPQSVESETLAVRESRGRLLVAEVVREVGEVGGHGPDLLRQFHGFRQTKVRRVRGLARRIQHQSSEARQAVAGLGGIRLTSVM